MTSSFFPGLPRAVKAAGAASIACLLVAACGGGGGGGAQMPAMLPTAAAAVATGDGTAPAQVPLGAAPCPGCAANGTDVPPALPNSKLNCAP